MAEPKPSLPELTPAYQRREIARHKSAILSGAVLSGQTESAQLDLQGYSIAGLIIPTITSGPISFKVAAVSGGTFVDLKKSDGALLSIPSTSGAIADSTLIDCLSPWRYIKIITVAQADGRVFQFVVKA